MVDASAAYRMNPLAALSIDRNGLVGENLRAHGGLFYPSMHPLSAEKPQEPGAPLPLGYELLYKPDASLLEGQKPANGYVGLYKNPAPGLQKPLLVPVGGADGLGLDHRVLPSDKQSDLVLSGAGSFLRLPWISPYADATMYPFLDMAYKASFLSQPSPFIHQQMSYQSLCAAGAGSSTAGEERLFYLPRYAPAHISSPLGPPIRIPTAPPGPAVLSPLPHCQDKVQQEPSAFSTSPPSRQELQPQHGTSSGPRSSLSSSTKNSSGGGGGSVAAVNSSASASATESPPVTRPQCPVAPPQPLSSPTSDVQKSLYRSSFSSSSSLHSSNLSSEHCSPLHSGSNKTKDAGSDRCSAATCQSPAKTPQDRAAPQKPAKNPGDKPLDLSAKDLEGFTNSFPASKLEALAKFGYLPPSHYGLLSGQDQNLKEAKAPAVSASLKSPDHPEKISSVSSPWIVVGPSTAVSSQIIKTKIGDGFPQSSSGSSTVEKNCGHSPASGGRTSAAASSSSPKPRGVLTTDVEQNRPNSKETHTSGSSAKPDVQENPPHPQQQLQPNASTQLFSDSYLPPGLGYTNRYIPYSVAETMSLQRMSIPGKATVYPHPVLLGSSSFYPPHMAPKHNLPYAVSPYQSSQELTPTPMSSYPGLNTAERLESRSKTQDKPTRTQERPDADRDKSTNQSTKASGKSPAAVREDVVCIDLVRDEVDDHSSSNRHSSPASRAEESSKPDSQDREPRDPKVLVEQRPGSKPPHPRSASPPPHKEEAPEETGEEEDEEEALSPSPDIPEEQTMSCARTAPQQFRRADKSGGSGAADWARSGTSGKDGVDGKTTSTEAKVDSDTSLGPAGRDSDCTSSLSPRSPVRGGGCHSDNTVCTSKAPVCGELRRPPPTGSTAVTHAPDVVNRNFVGPCCRHLSLRAPTCDPRTPAGPTPPSSVCRSITPRFTGCENQCAANIKAGAPVCSFSGATCAGKGPTCVSNRPPTYGKSFPQSPTCLHLNMCRPPPDWTTEPAADRDFKCEDTSPSTCGEGRTRPQDGDEEEEEPGCSRNRRSGLTRRIANSSGYVGDRFKCTTTELYADSSKLGREQRALQRAMLRFSELELKEKEGGRGEGDEEEGEMTAAAASTATGEMELAGGQRGGRGKEEEEEEEEGEERKTEGGGGGGEGGGGWERCQQSEGRRGGGGGGGRTPSAAAAEAPRGFQVPCPHGHAPSPATPVCRRHAHQEEEEHSTEEQKKNKVEEEECLEEEKKKPQQRVLPAARGLFQGHTHLMMSSPANRRRIFSLEPFHQSSIINSRLKRGREEGREGEDREGNPNKKTKVTDSALDEVKKLKVCIELNGLRLNKPRLPGELAHWLPPSSGQRSAEVDRKFRVDFPVIRVRSEVNGGWGDPTSVRKDSPRVFHVAPPSPPTHLPWQPCSPVPRQLAPASFASPSSSSRLQDKHQKLRESRRVTTFLPALPPLPPSSSSPDPHQFRCHDDDLDKPKGKRPCKTKHTGGGGGEARGEEGGEGGSDKEDEDKSGKFFPSDPSRSPGLRPLSPQNTLSARPVPPEVRRLIVNKNAGETLLQRAARLGYEEVVLYCLERRLCDINHRDNAGYCALHEACARGWLGIVRHLVEHGADVNCSAQDGTRPLHDAVENDHVEVVRFLLACGADPTLTSYSGRGPINMTHSATMETFLEDYLSDLQGRAEGDQGVYWEFYGSSVCEEPGEGGAYNVLADPPGPEEEEEDEEEEEEDEEQRARREVFEFELSDRPLLPCYNITVSLTHGPRNWLLLSDVLGRLRMTSRSFRRLFPQLNVQSVPEDEFYRQASLSQLLTGPDEQELSSFRPDVTDPLELVEATPELAGMLGSSLEFVDSRWDSLRASLPPSPQRAPAMVPPTAGNVSGLGPKNLGDSAQQHRGRGAGDPPTAKTNLTTNTSMWELQRSRAKSPAHLDSKMDASAWEPQRQRSQETGVALSEPKSSMWEPQSKKPGLVHPPDPDAKMESTTWEHQDSKTIIKCDPAAGSGVWKPQRLRSRNPANPDADVDAALSEPQQPQSKTANANPANGAADANAWKRHGEGTKILVSTNPGPSVDGGIWEPQRLQSKNAAISGPAKPDTNMWECYGMKRDGGSREANAGDSHGAKVTKMDATWQRNLSNVRVHIRDLGLRVGDGDVHRDVKKAQGKSARVKTRS